MDFFSWAYQVTPEGLKKTTNLPEDQSITIKINKRLNILIVIGLIAAITVSFFNGSKSTVFSSNISNNVTDKSIAVLPFEDLSSGGDSEWFCDGVTEEIRSNLSRIKGINKVISYTSVMQYKENRPTIPEIAKKLGVSYVLEGSVRKYNDKIIITTQLIDAHDNQIWSDHYNNNFDKIFEIQYAVSEEIVQQLQIVMSPEEEQLLNNSPTVNLEAYELYLRGRHLWKQFNTESVKRSIEYLEECIKLDSTYAPAYVTLAEDYLSLNVFIGNNAEKEIYRKKSNEAIDKALELDETLGEAYFTKGHLICMFEWEWEEMKKILDKGLYMDPNNSYGHTILAMYYWMKNDYNNAIEEVLLAERLDPLNPLVGLYVGLTYFLANDLERALKQYEKVLKLFPNYAFAWERAGHAQFFSGQKKISQSSFQKFLKYMGNDEMARIWSTESFDYSVNYWLEEAMKGDKNLCSNPTTIAQASMLVDNKQQALEYLELAYELRAADLPFYMIQPHFYTLHNEARFEDLVRKTGIILPENKLEYGLND